MARFEWRPSRRHSIAPCADRAAPSPLRSPPSAREGPAPSEPMSRVPRLARLGGAAARVERPEAREVGGAVGALHGLESRLRLRLVARGELGDAEMELGILGSLEAALR